MRFIKKSSLFLFLFMLSFGVNANVAFDTADPIFIESRGDFLTRSDIYFQKKILKVSQSFSYGIVDGFSLSASVKYQEDLNRADDGFSNIGLKSTFRLSNSTDYDSRFTTDLILGIDFGKKNGVTAREFSNTVYYGGVRVGHKWSSVTLASTFKSSWIFDKYNGMAYLNFIPEIYFRLSDVWMMGLNFDLQKSTNTSFDEEWVAFKLIRRYGRTQYIGHAGYEFEKNEYRYGLKLNVLF